jgi:protein-S-isoprenylcysteine O-methyltransferase Ste14
LFRFRGVTPLPVLVATVVLSWRAHIFPGPGGEAVDGALNFLGVGTTLVGWAMRFTTAGFEPTARSQTRRLHASALHTGGAYHLVRHPLYLGNALITLGLLMVLHRAVGYLLVLPAFALEYALLIRAEERLLHQTFGARWEAWSKDVPCFVPRLHWVAAFGGRPFDWRTAIRREMTPLVSLGLSALLLLEWEWWARMHLTPSRSLGVRVGIGALLGLLVANKVWKKVEPR